MKVGDIYSHLNGHEFLLVHHSDTLKEIFDVIEAVDAHKHRTKESKEQRKVGNLLWSPTALNKEFRNEFSKREGWSRRHRSFYVSTDPHVVKQLESMDNLQEQGALLDELGIEKHYSFNETDFVKNKIAVEVQLGKYFSVTYDLFVKHLSFYTGDIIDVGVEIVPMKSMQQNMSSGPPWFEKEVHNVLRHGRTNPPVPLLIIGIEPGDETN